MNEGQRECVRAKESERETGLTQRGAHVYPKWGSNSPDVELELKNGEIMTWAKVRCLTIGATQVPPASCLFLFLSLGLGQSWGKHGPF